MIGGFLIDETAKLLRTQNSWDISKCAVSFEGRPHPNTTDYFVGVFLTSDVNSTPGSTVNCVNVRNSFTCRVTKKIFGTPPDRLYEEYIDNTFSIMKVANTVRQTVLDNRTTLVTNVNSAITSASLHTNLILQAPPIWVRNDSSPTPQTNDWFYSHQPEQFDSLNTVGYTMDVVFESSWEPYIKTDIPKKQ